MKIQVLYFCNSMCRQTSILIVSKQQQCENDHLPNSSNFDRQGAWCFVAIVESYQMSPVIITGSVQITNSTLFLPLVVLPPLLTI